MIQFHRSEPHSNSTDVLMQQHKQNHQSHQHFQQLPPPQLQQHMSNVTNNKNIPQKTYNHQTNNNPNVNNNSKNYNVNFNRKNYQNNVSFSTNNKNNPVSSFGIDRSSFQTNGNSNTGLNNTTNMSGISSANPVKSYGSTFKAALAAAAAGRNNTNQMNGSFFDT